MSFVVYGLTHCRQCHNPLDDNLRCRHCEQLKAEKDAIIQKRIDRVLKSFDDFDLMALEELVHERAEILRKKDIEKKIEVLQQKLDKNKSD